MTTNIEMSGRRSLALSALLREIPAPARHLDIDAIQYCGRCQSPSFVAEWTMSDGAKPATWTQRVATALGARALLLQSRGEPIGSMTVTDLTHDAPPVGCSREEFLALCAGLLKISCHCQSFAANTFLRYAGGKGRLSRIILRQLPVVDRIVEPFAGSAAITGAMLANGYPLREIHLNDADPGVADLWVQVAESPNRLLAQCANFTPSLEVWDHLISSTPSGWATLALGAMSFGALGRMAGGPIGGREQRSEYSIGCRWSPRIVIDRIKWWHERLKKVHTTVTCEDAVEVLARDGGFAYVDPPYHAQGDKLYEQKVDHGKLRAVLRGRKGWALSLDEPVDEFDSTELCSRETTIGARYSEWLISNKI